VAFCVCVMWFGGGEGLALEHFDGVRSLEERIWK
jgi:hypothetical protein